MAQKGVGYTPPPGVEPKSNPWFHGTDFRAMLRDVFAKNPAWFKKRDPSHVPDDWDGKPTSEEGTLAQRCRDKELFNEAARVRALDLPKGSPMHPGPGQERWRPSFWKTYVDTNPDRLSEEDRQQIRNELEEMESD